MQHGVIVTLENLDRSDKLRLWIAYVKSCLQRVR